MSEEGIKNKTRQVQITITIIITIYTIQSVTRRDYKFADIYDK